MNSLKYFFRGSPDNIYFEIFSPVHFLLISISLLGIYLIYKYRELLSGDKLSKVFRKTVGITLLCQQSILYLWYIFTGFSSIKESLPLYNCRIAIICTALALLTDKKIFKNISIYWGIYGGILSLIVVEGDPFSFPHYTLVSFFVGHIFLLWGAVYLLLVDKYQINKINLKSTLKLTTIFHSMLLIFNIIVKSNYDYLMKPPILKDMLATIPQFLYSAIAIMIYNLLILISYFVINTFILKEEYFES